MGSNRTFMELKSRLKIDNTPNAESSNRTFMELKFQYLDIAVTARREVLIVPLWN